MKQLLNVPYSSHKEVRFTIERIITLVKVRGSSSAEIAKKTITSNNGCTILQAVRITERASL